MCGRYNVIPNAQGFVDAFDIVAGIETLPDKPRYNIAPTGEPVPVVRQESEGRELCQLRWPLLPHWAKEGRIKFATANAKGETVQDKPVLRTAWRKGRRCLIPANGYYEWQKGGERKQPYHIQMPLIISVRAYDDWLQGADPASMIRPFHGDVELYPVSTFVNNPRNDDPRCIEPL